MKKIRKSFLLLLVSTFLLSSFVLGYVRLTMTDGDWLKYNDREMNRLWSIADLTHYEFHIAHFHNHFAADTEEQFDFHMKHFSSGTSIPQSWTYVCPGFPSFEIFGYNVEVDRDKATLYIKLTKGISSADTNSYHKTYLLNQFDDQYVKVNKLKYDEKKYQAEATSVSSILKITNDVPKYHAFNLWLKVESLYNDNDDTTAINTVYAYKYDYRRIKINTKIKIENLQDYKVVEQIASVNLSKLPKNNINKLAAFYGDVELPSQLVDTNADGIVDNFTFLISLDSNQIKYISIGETTNKKVFKQRAHAEISEKVDYKLVDGVYTGGKFINVKRTKTPVGHIDHNLYYKCEGPCWESEKVAYRFYIDQRNGTDIFGKKVSEIILPNVGHTYDETGNEMYHTMQDWGMDIFKVGSSLGIGSFAAFDSGKVEMLTKRDSVICTIVNDGPIFASINTKYYGWKFGNQKIDVDANISIVAGSRLTKCDISLNGNHTNYCSGLAKYDGTEFIKSEIKNGWNYIALWGNQTSVHDNLGIVLFYNSGYEPKLTEDKLSYIVTFKPNNGKIEYYYAACWEQEQDGIKTKDEFLKYLNNEIEKLNNPLIIEIFR